MDSHRLSTLCYELKHCAGITHITVHTSMHAGVLHGSMVRFELPSYAFWCTGHTTEQCKYVLVDGNGKGKGLKKKILTVTTRNRTRDVHLRLAML